MRELKIFVSSPGDLAAERQIAKKVVEGFNNNLLAAGRYKFTAYLYEDHVPPLMGDSPQPIVDRQMIPSSEADIVICMLWWRYGTPLPADEGVNKYTGKQFGSGTEKEFYDALVAQKRRRQLFWRRAKPTILLYRKTATEHPWLEAPNQEVEDFFGRIERSWQVTTKDTRTEGIYQAFSTEEEFSQILQGNLEQLTAFWNRPSQRLLDQVLRPALPFLVILALALLLALYYFTRPPDLHEEDFNVAVARFVVDPAVDVAPQVADELSEALYRNLQTQLKAAEGELQIRTAVLGPGYLPNIEADIPLGAEAADDYFAQVGPVDLLIYGRVTRIGSEIVLQPHFQLAPRYPDTQDLVGHYRMEEERDIRTDPGTYSARLTRNSRILVAVVRGLSLVIAEDYDSAYMAYSAAIEDFGMTDGSEMLYLMRANASLMKYNAMSLDTQIREEQRKRLALANAQEDLNEALMFNPAYSRAYVALGSVLYLQYLADTGTLQDGSAVDDARLAEIEDIYQRAETATDSSEAADIEAKVKFGMAQLDLLRCLALESAMCDTADALFQAIIEEFAEEDNQRLRDRAAQSYGSRGQLALLGTEPDFEAARDFFSKAIEIGDYRNRREAFRRALMDVDFEQNRAARQWTEAADAYQELMSGRREVSEGQFVDTPIVGIAAARRLFALGKMYSEADMDPESINAYERALEQDLDAYPQYAAELYIELGQKHLDLGDVDASNESFQAAITLLQEAQTDLDSQDSRYAENSDTISMLEGIIDENNACQTDPACS